MKILVPVDGSPKSESTLPLAGRLAELWQAEILVLKVMDPTVGALDPLTTSLSDSAYQRMVAEDQLYLEDLCTRHKDFPMRPLHRIGSPLLCIDEVARQEACDLILMATHGHEGLVRWLWGSVAEGVARHAPCPSMLVRSPETPTVFRELLIPTDGSEESLSVAKRVGRFVGPETRVTLLHCTGALPQDKAEYLAQAELRNLLRQQVDGRPWMRLDFASNPAPRGILDWLANNRCDLIAMSTHGREGLARLWKGSVTEEVTRHSNCPVLTFPPPIFAHEPE